MLCPSVWWRHRQVVVLHRQVAQHLVIMNHICYGNKVATAIHLHRMTFQKLALCLCQPVANNRVRRTATAKHRIVGDAHTKEHHEECTNGRVDHVQVEVTMVPKANAIVQPG